MLLKIEHLGIAVDSLEESIPRYAQLLGVPCYKQERVEREGVLTAFFQVGPNKIELLEATSSDSPIAKFLEKKGKGFHHVAFETDNIDQEIQRLLDLDFQLIHLSPKEGADNKRIAFLHPNSSEKLLVELCQEKP
ncbi:MAG: methylmalonyl-CoA epimerase [Flavobacteriia bacterium]|jgi:methylmalonyl-CoA/ethylmalonyl-CoA epimerase|nr:methylmalonyl-CoA epimerase [Flavobacteriia bacterium]